MAVPTPMLAWARGRLVPKGATMFWIAFFSLLAALFGGLFSFA